MSHKAYSSHNYICEPNNIDIYFEYNHSVIFNTSEKTRLNGSRCKELLVITECELEEYYGVSEINRYSREDNLVIQGIISFFTGSPLTVYHAHSSATSVKPIKYEKQKFHLKVNGIDYSEDLITMLHKLNQEPELISTLLDRWRKALYLKEESCDADLYYDEAIISFFHIFELMGECVATKLKGKLEANIENMLYQHFNFYYFSGTKRKQMVEQNKKAVNRLLIGDALNLSIKVKYFLEQYELLDDNVDFFIDNMIKVRNEIAHGRITYKKEFLWPLSPFFNLTKNFYENIETLVFLSAEMISRYIGISCWEKEWNEIKIFLSPPNHVIAKFLNGKIEIEYFNYDILISGNKYNITWRTLFTYYVNKPQKNTRECMEAVTKDAFLNTLISEENGPDLFNISIIFSDSEDSDIKHKAIENIKSIILNHWYDWSNFKDAYSYLEYYSVKVIWYKEFLLNKEYLEI